MLAVIFSELIHIELLVQYLENSKNSENVMVEETCQYVTYVKDTVLYPQTVKQA